MLIPTAVSAEFFHTASGTAFIDLLINSHRETWPVRSKRFRTWLRRRHYETTGTAATAAAISSALDLFDAQAQFDGPERAVHVRLAEHAGHIYLDLADECWRAVEIGPSGWCIIGSPPVRFRRAARMLPLPLPKVGGSIEELASFLNLPGRNDFILVVAWLLATLRAGGPYPVLAISGEQGSAKTVLSKLLKDLVDPNVAPVRALAREERDLVIAANNSHVLAFDNLSGLPHALSDAFCRLATGASFGLRQLYTDGDEVLFRAARPILLNGIEDVIGQSDLADRALFLTLPPSLTVIGAPSVNYGVTSMWHDLAFWERCSPRSRTGCATCRASISNSYHAWQILLYGPQHAIRHSGRLARSLAPIRQTAGRRSRTWSTPIRSPLGCGRLWQTAGPGRELRPNFCVLVSTRRVIAPRVRPQLGRRPLGRSRVDFVVPRPSFELWALK
jgi:hypothetical protein